MTHTHDHEHDHNHEPDYITLVDENGNESLFQILITIDGQEEFGKNYVVLQPTEFEEDEQGLIVWFWPPIGLVCVAMLATISLISFLKK